jgi:phosphomevalonate decarboxylase
MKASATAYPIQGLIKYHGLRNEQLRLPFHDSISVCTAPIRTLTTIEFGQKGDSASFDDIMAKGWDMERILAVVDPLRRLAKE